MCLENCRLSNKPTINYNPLETECFNFEFEDTCDYIEVEDAKDIIVDQYDLTILQMNIRGLISKQRDLSKLLFDIIGDRKIDIVILCETWLTKESEHRVLVPGYTYYGHHRKHKNSGGVGFLVNEELTVKTANDYDMMCQHMESTFIELVLNGNNIIIGSLYRPPNTNAKDFVNDFVELNKRISHKHKNILLGLDHNLNLLNYENHAETQKFMEVLVDNGQFPCITRPTRLTHHSATLLDNILATKELYSVQQSSIIVSDLSDHLPCLSVFKNKKAGVETHEKIPKRCLIEKKINKIIEMIANTDLLSIVNNEETSVDQCAINLHSNIMDCIDKVAPFREIKTTAKKTYCEPWMSKGKLYRVYLISKKLEDKEKYKQYRNTLKGVKRKARRDFYYKQCVEFKRNTKKLWQMIN